MEYFVLSQKEESGCPVGFLQADLYDKFYSDTKGIEHGFFSWYAEKIHYKTHTPYPEGMVLISKDKFYDFDIRSIARFYIVSDEFMSVCSEMDVAVTDSVPIKVVSKAGENISSRNYNAVLFEELDARSQTYPASTFIEEDGLIFRFKKLLLPAGFNRDLFKFKGVVSGSNTLICSREFKKLAEGVKGVDFTPLECVIWSSVRPI